MSIKSHSWKDILQLAWPLIIANSFWNLQLTIDRIFLGMHSTESLGAAMAVMGIFWVPMALLQQTASYVTTFVAQYYGANEHKNIGKCLWQAFYVACIGGLFFLLLRYLSPLLFSVANHSPSMQVLERDYFNALTFSALPTAMVAAVSGFFTGLGRTKVVIGINLIGLILNVAFDYLLIFGNMGFPAMGIAGAGYATAIATVGAMLFALTLVFTKSNELSFGIKSQFALDKNLIAQFLKYGLPSGLQWALEGLAFTAFLTIIGQFSNGEAALASSSIAVTIMMLSVLPSMGIAQAVMTLVGQKLGEQRPEEATAITWIGVKLSAIYMSIAALSFCFLPEFYLSWFHNESNPTLWREVTFLTPFILKMVAIITLFDSIYLNISFALKGAGDTRFVSLLTLTLPYPVMVLPTYLLKNHENAVFTSWGFIVLYSFLMMIVLTLRFRGGKWKSMSVIH